MTSAPPDRFIAHRRETDGEVQSVACHLIETADLGGKFASRIGLPLCGRLLGLTHDLGKYSNAFLDYIESVTGIRGVETQETAQASRGKLDHATAGAQLIWNRLPDTKPARALAQILSVAVMSHHSRTGMKDFISLSGTSPFLQRMAKCEADTHFAEAVRNAHPHILREIDEIVHSDQLIDEFNSVARRLENCVSELIPRFVHYSLLARFLFSCLLDADRTGTADFEKPEAARLRSADHVPDWNMLATKLERHLAELPAGNDIDDIRKRVSAECKAAARRERGIFTLTVPTGGGKTLASLRFALHHAAKTSRRAAPVERIIYVIPYTTIIDQNAKVVRGIIGNEHVLEHHSNLVPDNLVPNTDTWRNRVLSENWDAPVVFTTSVQFLNALFDAPTGRARRMHRLANSIIIFDEIQALPVKTIHAFNNAVHFLTAICNSTAVLCTATQPLLGEVDSTQGAMPITAESEIVTDKASLFRQLKRTEIIDHCRPQGWSFKQVAGFVIEQQDDHGSVLVVCNTKKSARKVFESLQQSTAAELVHLSTNMCPAHRKAKIDFIGSRLGAENRQPVICVSTQLIEAGVDLDFGCVVRSIAGFDSIVQAGGRANRNGEGSTAPVFVLNFNEEKLGAALEDIAEGQEITSRIFREFKKDPESLGRDLLSEATMQRFYQYHFFRRASEMPYPIEAGKGHPPAPANTTMIALLAKNELAVQSAQRRGAAGDTLTLPLKQAYSTAATQFEVINAPTQGVVIPYGQEGSELIGELAAAFSEGGHPLPRQIALLKRAQQFSVNLYPHTIAKLQSEGAIRRLGAETEILHLDERHYHEHFGVTEQPLSPEATLQV